MSSSVKLRDMWKPAIKTNDHCLHLREDFYSEISPRTNKNLLKTELCTLSNSVKDIDENDRQVSNYLVEKRRNAPKSLQQQVDASKQGVEYQLEESSKKLNNLIAVGQQLVMNVKIANERRENIRSQYELLQKAEFQKDLQKESIESLARFNNIASKWSELELMDDPIEVSKSLKEQEQCVAGILKDKDTIIEKCQEGIDFISHIYYTEKENSWNDINNLVERIDKQIELLKNAYKEQFYFVYDNMKNERKETEHEVGNKWKSFYSEMLENEDTKFNIVKEKKVFYAREINRIREEQEAITRASRIRLEKEEEILQRELRNSKNMALIASEKLDYNYQVLQKRNEENVIINNQQKRRVAKLNEGILTLKKKIRDVSLNAEASVCRLGTHIKKVHANIIDLEDKFELFKEKNDEKLNGICSINLNEIQTILNKIFEIDKILHEQLLAIPWTKPELDTASFDAILHPNLNPIKKKIQSSVIKTKDENQLNWRLLRNILRGISDRADYLVEENLLEILKTFRESDNCLIRLESIFTALKINDFKLIYSLVKIFEPYCWCPNCSEDDPPPGLKNVFVSEDGTDKMSIRSVNFERDIRFKKKLRRKKKICDDHYLVIEPGLVITALHTFTKSGVNEVKSTKIRNRDDEKKSYDIFSNIESINAFWEKVYACMPPKKSTLWSSLSHGLTHYMEVLVTRQRLDGECNFLRKQNMEFRHMFQKID